MVRVQRFLMVLVVVGTAMSGHLASAATYYVAKAGNNNNAGSEAAPFLTINYGVARLVAGDTLLVQAGVYDESLIYNVPSGTSWTNKVRIAAAPGQVVTMRPSSGSLVVAFAGAADGGNSGEQKYIEFDGINLDASALTNEAIKVEAGPGYNAHHLRFQNLDVTSSNSGIGGEGQHPGAANAILATALRSDAIGFNEFINLTVHGGPNQDVGLDFSSMFYLQSPDNLIDHCLIYDGIGAGVQIYNGNSPGTMPDRTIVRNTIIRDFTRSPATRDYGIITARGTGHQIYNNLIYNIAATGGGTGGIYIYNATNVEVYNNTLTGNAAGGILVESTASGAVVKNNISYGNGGVGDYVDRGEGTTASTNLFGTNPLFVSPSTGNYATQADSPAVNAGSALPVVPADLVGIARPQGGAFDIGAFEFQAPGSAAPAARTATH